MGDLAPAGDAVGNIRQPETQFSVAKTSHARFCKAKTEGKRSKHGKQRKQDFQAASVAIPKAA